MADCSMETTNSSIYTPPPCVLVPVTVLVELKLAKIMPQIKPSIHLFKKNLQLLRGHTPPPPCVLVPL